MNAALHVPSGVLISTSFSVTGMSAADAAPRRPRCPPRCPSRRNRVVKDPQPWVFSYVVVVGDATVRALRPPSWYRSIGPPRYTGWPRSPGDEYSPGLASGATNSEPLTEGLRESSCQSARCDRVGSEARQHAPVMYRLVCLAARAGLKLQPMVRICLREFCGIRSSAVVMRPDRLQRTSSGHGCRFNQLESSSCFAMRRSRVRSPSAPPLSASRGRFTEATLLATESVQAGNPVAQQSTRGQNTERSAKKSQANLAKGGL